ncbi:hypothetical protein COK91_30050 [Bacillus cereus]|uniref:hypothetical protein n=1 Tax=Bacillus cereus TaxID=1396 RepID=UPI000BF79B58|nr:hypothetical protein [Bacillus cereus]PFU76109.1 hypothetical protein COK91_30050 [Bacillus cereus]
MIKAFKEMFQNHTTQSKSSGDYLTIGKMLPAHLTKFSYDDPWLLCAISLSCMKCIDLLPNIQKIESVYNGGFLLVTDGSIEDIEEIKQYFKFNFNIISFGKELTVEGGFQETPSLCLIDKNNKIIAMEVIDDIEDPTKYLYSIVGGED